MKNFCIITANWNRPDVLALWCASIKRIREDLDIFIPAVVVSDRWDRDTCDKYHVHHINHKNNPVSEKFNAGCQYARSLGVDYVMILGSDDIVSTETISRYMTAMEQEYDVIGTANVYFYGRGVKGVKTLVHLQRDKKMLGVGKTISAKVMEQVDWRPWKDEKNWALDAICHKYISPFIGTSHILEETKIFDCKTSTNINKFSFWYNKIKTTVDLNVFYDILGEEEKELIKRI